MQAAMLDITADLNFETDVTDIYYRTHEAYAGTKFDNNDEIRISIQNQDAYTVPSMSFIHIEGQLLTIEGKAATKTKLVNNAFSYLISECRYLLNGIPIDETRNLGTLTTIKGNVSYTPHQAKRLVYTGWDDANTLVNSDGTFTAIIPLRHLIGFGEDYKKIVMNLKQEIVLTRSQNDLNAIKTDRAATEGAQEKVKITISNINWRMAYVEVSDAARLSLLKVLQADRPIELGFRSWNICEMPMQPNSNKISWQVQTTNKIERPRFVIVTLQTGKKDSATENATHFDHCKIRNVKLYLNEKAYPYDNMNLNIPKQNVALMYENYCKFQETYYEKDEASPLLSLDKFVKESPLVVIDCSKQNEAIKSGSVDVRLEIESSDAFPANTVAYCLLLHDRIVDYTPMTGIVRKHI
jgi:hypothetical protein